MHHYDLPAWVLASKWLQWSSCELSASFKSSLLCTSVIQAHRGSVLIVTAIYLQTELVNISDMRILSDIWPPPSPGGGHILISDISVTFCVYMVVETHIQIDCKLYEPTTSSFPMVRTEIDCRVLRSSPDSFQPQFHFNCWCHWSALTNAQDLF